MINYTERIALLMKDVISRTPRLSFIDLREVIVFARFGRSDAEGAYATCHCLTLPESEPGYYFWKDRETGELTRRSPWFITKSPQVKVGETQIKYLISFVLPRFSDQTLEGTRKAGFYDRTESWIAKLDTIIHELYHIDPGTSGLRAIENADGTNSFRSHGPRFYENVAEMVQQYLDSRPDPELLDFLKYDFSQLNDRFGGVIATTFRNFPSFPQRYIEAVDLPSADPCLKVEPLKTPTQPAIYTESDLYIRQFTGDRSRRLGRKDQDFAA